MSVGGLHAPYSGPPARFVTKPNTLASENPNPLPQLRLHGLDLTRQVAPGIYSPVYPNHSAWPELF